MIVLPADFIDNRIIVRPVTDKGVRLQLYTDTGGASFLLMDAVKRAGLTTSDSVISGSQTSVLAQQPQYVTNNWIPSVVDNGEEVGLRVVELNVPHLAGFDGMLGAAWFADRIWTFDYLEKTFIYYDDPNSDQAAKIRSGNGVPLYFQKNNNGNQTTCFPRIQAEIDGETIDFLFDTGASLRLSDVGHQELNPTGNPTIGTSFITEAVFRRWAAKHPEWRIYHDAEHQTKLPVIEVPELRIAGYTVGPVTFVMRPDPNFHEYMSQWMDKRIEGALGGSAFQYCRISVDYIGERAYFER